MIPSPRAEANIQMVRLLCFNVGLCRANAEPPYQSTGTLVHQIRSADLARMIEFRATRKGDSLPRVDFIDVARRYIAFGDAVSGAISRKKTRFKYVYAEEEHRY